jgi:ParB family chromosome partitioning protein
LAGLSTSRTGPPRPQPWLPSRWQLRTDGRRHGEGYTEVAAVDVDPTTPAADRLGEVAGATYAELPVDGIAPNPRQPREVFDEEAMAELVASIAEVGLLQPS